LGATLDQPHAKAVFEFAHMARQRRLGSPGEATSSTETAMGGNEVEVRQSFEIHRMDVPISRQVVPNMASPAHDWNAYLSLDTHKHHKEFSQWLFW
jgi:hypothetical protein